MNRADFPFFHRLRVRWAEVDMQKIVFNAHYLMYVDTALADYWRALALPYAASMERLGGDLYVKKATLEYHASAQADDPLEIGLRCARIGNSSLLFDAGVFCAGRLLVEAQLVYVFAAPATQTSRPVPQPLRDVLAAHAAGERMTDVRRADWATLGADARTVREQVFVREQGVPAGVEQDGADATALHAVSYNRLGMPIGTARLLAQHDSASQLGRMAVDRALRGTGVGTQLLQTLIAAASARGDRELRLHAQSSAVEFYGRFGFCTHGEPFDVAGIPHQEMALVLMRADPLPPNSMPPDQTSASSA